MSSTSRNLSRSIPVVKLTNMVLPNHRAGCANWSAGFYFSRLAGLGGDGLE